MDNDYQAADAPCGFCNGPMPCWCKPTFDVAQAHEDDAKARDKWADPLYELHSGFNNP